MTIARLASTSIAGFYPTPPHLVARIAALVGAPEPLPAGEDGEALSYAAQLRDNRGEPSFLDPCAGEGAALLEIMSALVPNLKSNKAMLYGCEMEAGRFDTFKKAAEDITWALGKNILAGDAFSLTAERSDSKSGISLLYLNPPYDTDPIHGRLEQKFLARFTPTLMFGGILLFVVPFYALAASAELLAQEYTNLHCFRFPQVDFDGYKQIVLFATRGGGLFDPDPALLAQVRAWAADASTVQALPEIGSAPLASLPLPDRYSAGLETWLMRPIDITSLVAKIEPWAQTTRSGALIQVPGVLPELPVQDLLLRSYPIATPPRPAHIAAGIASGLFNGARIEPSNPATKLPPVLVKGVFDREYKTVEEKTNKDGEVRAVVQVQQPKLVTTVLDLTTHQYHVLRTGVEETGSLDIGSMGVADLLKHYSESLMRVMERQCPILYDPRRDADSIPLAPSPRRLFTAQAHASRALVKLLGGLNVPKARRKGKAAILLGEIGSGKSTVSMMAARTIKARRPLIMCPPHLLKGWTNEIAAVLPDAEVRILSSVAEIDEIAALPPSDRTIVSILSRESAKLSHGWLGAGAVCPKCGSMTPEGVDLAKKRARCEVRGLIAADDLAKETVKLALTLSRFAPNHSSVVNVLRGRFDRIRLERYCASLKAGKKTAFHGLDAATVEVAIDHLIARRDGDRDRTNRAIVLALLAVGDNDLIERTARKVLKTEMSSYQNIGIDLLLMLPPHGEQQTAIMTEMKETHKSSSTWGYNPWSSLKDQVDRAIKGESHVRIGPVPVSWKTGALIMDDDMAPRSLKAATSALSAIGMVSHFTWTDECGEELFQAIAEPRRVALARHIVKYHRDLFDFLVLDEGHEYATDGSAQERSAHRLTSLGLPTILMTGTIMNGYAESLFTNMWALSPGFRAEFDRDARQLFVDRYGYRKRVLEDRDRETGEIVEFGTMSDRVTRSERVVGNAPGILPLFLLRHLLPISVTLHKTDLAIDLPPCRQHRHMITPSAELKKRYESLQTTLIGRIRKDQFTPDLAGRLWGQLAEMPSYLDRATSDTGNTEDGSYEIRYPESVGGQLVASQAPLDGATLLPKEAWLLDLLEKELEEGRNVMVFSWHVSLLPRLARLISNRIGEPVPVLYADKVSTGKRQDWIDKEVVKKRRRVLVTNPVAIQTGLNNLVHFASEVWMENPACNPVTFRQAVGRVDRIGQKIETRIHFPIYEGTMQVALFDLLMKKVAVSVSTDGLDPESALQAAGVGEDEYLAGLSIGKQLWAMLSDGVKAKAA